MLKATVSGSFHRHMFGIYDAVGNLRELGVEVLSPSDPRVVDNIGEFLFVASDKLRSIKLVQDRHFDAIRHSDFLWVVCPDGYTGPSTASEIGAAHVLGVPVFADTCPIDITITQYVTKVASPVEAMRAVLRDRRRPDATDTSLLLDPKFIVNDSISQLLKLEELLLNPKSVDTRYLEGAVKNSRSQITKRIG